MRRQDQTFRRLEESSQTAGPRGNQSNCRLVGQRIPPQRPSKVPDGTTGDAPAITPVEAGGVFGDKGFIGTDYITTPIRKPECRELLQWEHEWNNRVSSFRAPVERAVATLKTWRILFTDYRRPLKTFNSSFHAAIGLYFFKETFA